MNKQKQIENRKAIEADAKHVYEEIMKSPTIERWMAKAHPVDKQKYKGNMRKVFEGAAELLWIHANDCIWVPYANGDIHMQKGEATMRIRDFITLYPSIDFLHNPITHIILLEEAARTAAAINIDDANDRVWEYYRGAICTKGAAAPSKRMEPNWPRLYEALDANKTNPEHWGDFIDVLKEYCQGDAINMARIAWILRAGKFIATPMAWGAWYNLFCIRCGLEPCATYAKDAKKINPSGDATRNIARKMGESGFLRDKRSGEPMNHHHTPIDKMGI